jgi:hypothetical protein
MADKATVILPRDP